MLFEDTIDVYVFCTLTINLSLINPLPLHCNHFHSQVFQASACIPSEGCFYPPTLITNVQTVSTVVVEEVI